MGCAANGLTGANTALRLGKEAQAPIPGGSSSRLLKQREAVDLLTIGEESDEITIIVDAIDDGPGHGERGHLARSRGVDLKKYGCICISKEAVRCTLPYLER